VHNLALAIISKTPVYVAVSGRSRELIQLRIAIGILDLVMNLHNASRYLDVKVHPSISVTTYRFVFLFLVNAK